MLFFSRICFALTFPLIVDPGFHRAETIFHEIFIFIVTINANNVSQRDNIYVVVKIGNLSTN